MDSILQNFNTIICGLFALTLFFYYFLKKHKSSKGITLPPQPYGKWPIIGHFPLLSGSNPPHLALATLADKYGPAFTLQMGVNSILVVSNSEIAKELFTTNDTSLTSRPPIVAAKLMGYNYAFFPFTPDGGLYWRETRKICTSELLSNRQIELFKHIKLEEVEASIKELYQIWKGNRKTLVALNEWWSNLNHNVFTRMIIGKKYFGAGATGDLNEGSRFDEVLNIFFHYLGRPVLGDAFPFLGWLDVGGHHKKMKIAANELDEILQKWLQEHKQNQPVDTAEDQKDFMDVMLSVLDNKSIEGYDNDTIIKATCLAMVAGYETISVAITWVLSLLLNNKHVLKKAQEELDMHVGKERLVNDKDVNNLVYLQAIVKESLRLYPPTLIPGPRMFTKDCTIGGYHVPKGTWLMINLWKMHRDPNVWPNPMEFKPERFLTTHKDVNVRSRNFELLPFGGGRRGCPGVSFSLPMMHLIIASLLHAFDLTTPTDAPLDMSFTHGLTFKKITPLEVLISPRLSLSCFE